MRTALKLLVVAGLLLLAGSARAQDPKFYIFLCLGQSNMEGFPGIPDEDKVGVDERFQVLAAVDFPDLGRTKDQWYPAVPPLCRPGTGLCPADTFGRTLAAALPRDVRVGVINVAVAGCKIELFDKAGAGAYAATAPDWMKRIIAAYGGSPYARLVELARRAQQDGVIKGILLHQGESNADDKDWPKKVDTLYRNLLGDLDLRPENVPLLAGELVGADQEGKCAGMNLIIADLPRSIPTAHVVSSAGCPCRPDHLHFAPEGYRILGRRYAEAMLPLLNPGVEK